MMTSVSNKLNTDTQSALASRRVTAANCPIHVSNSQGESDIGKTLRHLLKEYWLEHARVEASRLRIMNDKEEAQRRASFFVSHGFWPPLPVLPPWPEFPRECRGMVCGGRGRRSGRPCQSQEIYPNGRCKWHGGASTGPKTAEGRARSQSNLRRGPKL
jgi:hypothetical protein